MVTGAKDKKWHGGRLWCSPPVNCRIIGPISFDEAISSKSYCKAGLHSLLDVRTIGHCAKLHAAADRSPVRMPTAADRTQVRMSADADRTQCACPVQMFFSLPKPYLPNIVTSLQVAEVKK
jgi:hypothetical protein